MKKTILLLLILLNTQINFSQCVSDETNVYYFEFNGHSYEFISETKNWINAAACAVERGGYLVEINDAAENQEIITKISSNLPTVEVLWIGGNDFTSEGDWIWDGNNDGNGAQFWQGDFNGSPVGGLYNNWGVNTSTGDSEPDDAGGQDALQIWLFDWCCGTSGQWNDRSHTTTDFYLIEYNNVLGINEVEDKKYNFTIYPNPSIGEINVEIYDTTEIDNITIKVFDVRGVQVKKYIGDDKIKLDISNLQNGVYFVILENDSLSFEAKKIIIQK